jgi:hypothetical protein
MCVCARVCVCVHVYANVCLCMRVFEYVCLYVPNIVLDMMYIVIVCLLDLGYYSVVIYLQLTVPGPCGVTGRAL